MMRFVSQLIDAFLFLLLQKTSFKQRILCVPLCKPWCPFVVKTFLFYHKGTRSKIQRNTKGNQSTINGNTRPLSH